MTKTVKAYLESYFLAGNMNRTDRMTAKDMVEQLQILANEGEIEVEDVPELTTVASWITRYAANLKKQSAIEKVTEGSNTAKWQDLVVKNRVVMNVILIVIVSR